MPIRKTKGFTPFLDSLMRSGLCFKRMYANGTRSIQAMPSVLGSIPSFQTPFVLMPQSLGESRQLPAILRDKGYARRSSAVRNAARWASGPMPVRQASSGSSAARTTKPARQRDFDGYWGIWDEPFLQFTGEELSEPRNLSSPRSSPSRRTTRSSYPHDTTTRCPTATPNPQGRGLRRQRIPPLLRALRREEWFRRTIFVFVADHVSSEKFATVTRTYPATTTSSASCTPRRRAAGRGRRVVQQLDIMPTLLGLVATRSPISHSDATC